MMIKLTHPERRLRDLLVAAANAWPRKTEQSEPLVVRFAGGWVRDKLLSQDTHDIDVALNIATGVQFASHIENFVHQNPLDIEERFHFNTINRNVEQSKHLETATAHFMGIDLDFVNLRNEEYADNSRIPETMKFGSPKADAERRDLTINSLFYNLHTETVEDFTGMGLDDMKKGIIRTPLDPMSTFMDDPLRVLRAARFAARFNFEITPEVKVAMMNSTVKNRLRTNVTIPRKADEIQKLLKGPNHLQALKLIDDCCLYNHIFTLSKRDAATSPSVSGKKSSFSIEGVQDPPNSPSESVAAGQLVLYLQQHRIAEFLKLNTIPLSLVSLPWILAGLTPWRGVLHPNPPKKEPKFLSSLIVKHELMYGEEIRNVVVDIFEKGKMDLVKDAAERNILQTISRNEVVSLVRRLGQYWRWVTFTLLLYEMLPFALSLQRSSFENPLVLYSELANTIYSMNLEEAYAVKRLIPGNELSQLLGGLEIRQIADAQEKAVEYQIVENITTRKEMEDAIATKKFRYP